MRGKLTHKEKTRWRSDSAKRMPQRSQPRGHQGSVPFKLHSQGRCLYRVLELCLPWLPSVQDGHALDEKQQTVRQLPSSR